MELTNKLIGPCGMNCGICAAYLRKKNKCPGCREADANITVGFLKCKIKNCEVLREGKVKFCFECKQFPCPRVKNMDKRYRTKYNMSTIDNLENIKNYGIRKFVSNEKVRWACPKCGGAICVHKGYCFSCGEK